MLRVFILEDEEPARDRLVAMVAALAPPCTVVATADSIASARRYLAAARDPAPDLIFADIQLGDGSSIDLFRAAPPPCPVVFVTAHDEFVLEAFGSNGIAYLLKPVKQPELAAAVAKYRELGRHFTGNLASLAATLGPVRWRERILAQRGRSFQPVAIADVAYFYSENKLAFLVTRSGERCMINEPLSALEAGLDPAQFFRINRNYLVHAGAVRSFSSVGKGRIAVELSPRTAGEVLVSQENGAAFKAWAAGGPV